MIVLKMLGDSTDINKLCCDPVALEKYIGKTSKTCHICAQLTQKDRFIMDHALNVKQFFLAKITKADHQLSEKFCFISFFY